MLKIIRICVEVCRGMSSYVEVRRSRHVELGVGTINIHNWIGIVVSFVSIADNRLALTCPLLINRFVRCYFR